MSDQDSPMEDLGSENQVQDAFDVPVDRVVEAASKIVDESASQPKDVCVFSGCGALIKINGHMFCAANSE